MQTPTGRHRGGAGGRQRRALLLDPTGGEGVAPAASRRSPPLRLLPRDGRRPLCPSGVPGGRRLRCHPPAKTLLDLLARARVALAAGRRASPPWLHPRGGRRPPRPSEVPGGRLLHCHPPARTLLASTGWAGVARAASRRLQLPRRLRRGGPHPPRPQAVPGGRPLRCHPPAMPTLAESVGEARRFCLLPRLHRGRRLRRRRRSGRPTSPTMRAGPPPPCLRRARFTWRRHRRPPPAPRMMWGGRRLVDPWRPPLTGWELAAARMAAGRRWWPPTATRAPAAGRWARLPTATLARVDGCRWRGPMAMADGQVTAMRAAVRGAGHRPLLPQQAVKQQVVLSRRRGRGLAQPPPSSRPWRKTCRLVGRPRQPLTLRGPALLSRR